MFGRRGRRIASAVAIFLTAIALQRACTQPWGRAAAPDGTRYELSAVGLSRLGRAATDARHDCRWWPRYGDPTLCAVGTRPDAAPAHEGLRRAYPMLQVALWLAIFSVFFQALRIPRQRLLQAAVPATSCALTLGALAALSRGARVGLAALEGSALDFALQGYYGAILAVVLSALAALLVATSFSASPDAESPR